MKFRFTLHVRRIECFENKKTYMIHVTKAAPVVPGFSWHAGVYVDIPSNDYIENDYLEIQSVSLTLNKTIELDLGMQTINENELEGFMEFLQSNGWEVFKH